MPIELVPDRTDPMYEVRRRHEMAWSHGNPWSSALDAARRLAEKHEETYETRIGRDEVLGPAWGGILAGLRELLNGDLGGLDGGLCDRELLNLAERHGWNLDQGKAGPPRKQYQSVVFMQQDTDAAEPLRILDEQGVEAAIEYLAQWDNGDPGTDWGPPGSGDSDDHEEIGDYRLTWNQGLGYIGLERIKED